MPKQNAGFKCSRWPWVTFYSNITPLFTNANNFPNWCFLLPLPLTKHRLWQQFSPADSSTFLPILNISFTATVYSFLPHDFNLQFCCLWGVRINIQQVGGLTCSSVKTKYCWHLIFTVRTNTFVYSVITYSFLYFCSCLKVCLLWSCPQSADK